MNIITKNIVHCVYINRWRQFKDMKINILIIVFLSILWGCEPDNFNDSSKRNENWSWFIEENSEKGEWRKIVNKKMNITGKYVLFYSNGNIREKGTILNGNFVDTISIFNISGIIIKYSIHTKDSTYDYYIKNGIYKSYYSTGESKEVGVVNNHKKSDLWKKYHKSGNIKSKSYILNDSIAVKTDYYTNGQLLDSFTLLNGDNRNHGTIKFWHKNGQLKEIAEWKKGLQNGIYKLYFQNGQLKYSSYLKSGKIVSKSIGYFENGKVRFVNYYRNGIDNGSDTSYYPNGKIRYSGKMVNGKKEGRWNVYYKNGNIFSDGIYKNGNLEGEFKGYTISGELYTIDYYKAGKYINSKEIKELNKDEQKHIDYIIKYNEKIKNEKY